MEAYDIYRIIFIASAILCGIMVVASVLIFILMKIPSVISDLTGKTARRAIADIRQKNEAGGGKAYKSSTSKVGRIKVEDKMTPSGNIAQKRSHMGHPVETTKIATDDLKREAAASMGIAPDTTVLGGNETTVLGGGSETAVLGGNETTVLSGSSETVVLSQPAQDGIPVAMAGTTTRLTAEEQAAQAEAAAQPAAEAPAKSAQEVKYPGGFGETCVLSNFTPPAPGAAQGGIFVIEKDITFIHSDEIIEAGA